MVSLTAAEISAPFSFVTRLAGDVSGGAAPSADSVVDWPFCDLFAANFAKADASIASAKFVPQPAPGLKN